MTKSFDGSETISGESAALLANGIFLNYGSIKPTKPRETIDGRHDLELFKKISELNKKGDYSFDEESRKSTEKLNTLKQHVK
jgi:hypothetical protein